MNPSLAKSEHALTIDGSSAAPSIETALQTAELYRLAKGPARAIVEEVRAAVSGWQDEARRQALPAAEVKRMASVIQA